MTVIDYKGINLHGRVVTGRLAVGSVESCESYLRDINITPVSCRDREQSWLVVSGLDHLRLSTSSLRTRVKLANHLQSVARMLESGVPLHSALQVINMGEREGVMYRGFALIRTNIGNGEPLSTAFSKTGLPLKESHLVQLKVAERVGDLAPCLEDISASLLWNAGFEKRIRAAMIYPMIVFCLLLSLMFFLLVFVVPSLAKFLAGVDGELSWQTRVLINASELLAETGSSTYLLLILMAGICVFFFRRWDRARLFYDYAMTHLPVAGRVVKESELARFSYELQQLYGSGVNILDSIEMAHQIVSNRHLSFCLDIVSEQVRDGVSLGDALRSSGVFSSECLQMVQVGETAGQLSSSLLRMSQHQAIKAGGSLDTLERNIPPALLMMVGLFLLWIMVAVFSPVYSVAIQTSTVL